MTRNGKHCHFSVLSISHYSQISKKEKFAIPAKLSSCSLVERAKKMTHNEWCQINTVQVLHYYVNYALILPFIWHMLFIFRNIKRPLSLL
jgi:hypothetical protein